MKKTLLLTIMLSITLPATAGEKVINLYKSQNCGCCVQWGKVIEQAGFQVNTHVMNDAELNQLKDTYAIPTNLRSFHTATYNNLVIEGHVPVDLVEKAAISGTSIAGLATPGMPIGSPGMEMDNKKEAYDVIAFNKDGTQKLFQRVE